MSIILSGSNGETFPSWTTASRPASPVAGQQGFNSTLPAMEYYDGTIWRQSNVINSGTAQAASGTSILFTGIPSGVKRITVLLSTLTTNGTSPWLFQLGSGTIQTTGYLSNSSYNGATNGGTSSTAGFVIYNDTVGRNPSGIMTICLLDPTNRIWVASFVGAPTSLANYTYLSGGTVTLTAANPDRLNITTVIGTNTFTAGSVNIFYE